jgi:hypothetical protein
MIDKKNVLDIELGPDEEVSDETLKELSNGKGEE